MPSYIRQCLPLLIVVIAPGITEAGDAPDIRSVSPDLVVPPVTSDQLDAGRRCWVEDEFSGVSYVVWLPPDWKASSSRPVIIELPGNGGYRSPYGDTCTGRPEDCSLGYGVTGGTGAIWVCVPFLTAEGTDIAVTWWGDAPKYDPRPTVALLQRVVDFACSPQLNGDPQRVVLAGFSRGSIACSYVGLADPQIASLWRGMICYSHYDGVREAWPYPNCDRTSALQRIRRLTDRPQFICHESDARPAVSLSAAQTFLEDAGMSGQHLTFCETGFRNHSDQWVLRPGPARKRLRTWFQNLVQD